MDALHAQRANLALSVFTFERGQVDHPDREIERPKLRIAFDRTFLQAVDALIDAHLVHSADSFNSRLDAVGATNPSAHERTGLAFSRDTCG